MTLGYGKTKKHENINKQKAWYKWRLKQRRNEGVNMLNKLVVTLSDRMTWEDVQKLARIIRAQEFVESVEFKNPTAETIDTDGPIRDSDIMIATRNVTGP